MSKTVDKHTVVVVPNWNGDKTLEDCLKSIANQSFSNHVIVVDNGSTDGSIELLANHEGVEIIKHSSNKGFAGGVNAGIQSALKQGYRYIALLNNDAVAHKDWLKQLVSVLETAPNVGIVTSKILSADGKYLDSTGDFYTTWGLPYPRGRGEKDTGQYDNDKEVFGASGGASLYRAKLFEEIGLFDEDFFAYYEDVDISFRAQLAGWRVLYEPSAVVHHQIGATSGRIKGFTTYQTMKNLPLLMTKNVPRRYFWYIGWRLTIARTLFLLRAFTRGHGWAAVKGDVQSSLLLGRAKKAREQIQAKRKVDDDYFWLHMLVHDLPPNARALRKLRFFFSLGFIK